MRLIRNIFITISLLVYSTLSLAAQGIEWHSAVEQVGEGRYKVTFSTDIERGWHIYDMSKYEYITPLSFAFEGSDGVRLASQPNLLNPPEHKFDELMGEQVGWIDGAAVVEQFIEIDGEGGAARVTVEWASCTDMMCLPPADTTFTIEIGKLSSNELTFKPIVYQEKATITKSGSSQDNSLLRVILGAMLWGLVALFTPCVFPMIPMTVSFFMKDSESPARNRFRAIAYGIFIVLLYTLPIAILILVTRFVGGDTITADIFNWLSTHWLPNIIFFLVFMLFAAAFFGAFEITIPSKFVNKSDKKADKGGLVGVFFMALTLVLVSFSCTGPLVGNALIESTTGGSFWAPIFTMLAFSVVFALPFTLFAFFPTLLKRLPKSGGWLNSVKVVIGFLEVALGFKFLSVADQTYHWGILDREVYIAIWIVVFSLMGAYLLGKLKFKHDSDVKFVSVPRLALSIATFTFVVYLIPGMFGAPLKALSGYLPPMYTHDFVVTQLGYGGGGAQSDSRHKSVKYGEFLHLPHGLDGFFDLEEAQAYADKVGKPLFIDFTGHGCVNCREMEARVWSDPHVLDILRNDYVIVAMYVDDKTILPKEDWVTTDTGRVLKGLGKINSHILMKRYGANAQPYYVLQGRDGVILNKPMGYNLNIEDFKAFLRSGLNAYEANN